MSHFKKVFIRTISDQSIIQHNQIKVSKRLYDTFQIKTNQPINLRCGQKTIVVYPSPVEEKEITLYCAQSLMNALYLPENMQSFRLFYDTASYTLYLAPVIAVLTQFNGNQRSLSNLADFCEEMNQYCKNHHIFFYIFSVKGWQEEYIDGYVYENNEWVLKKAPIPNVIFNRIHSRKFEKSERVQTFFQHIKRINIPYFNDHFLNKWDVYQMINSFEYMQPHIPETKLMNGLSSLTDMLKNYETIFIKPVHGSLGKDIFRIQQQKDGEWTIDYSSFSGEIDHTFSSIPSLYQSLRERLFKQRFLIQQGIDLLTYDNRPLDFRILCHQDPHGKWQVTSAVARVSNEKTFVSNVAKGGEIFKPNEILLEQFEKKHAIQIKKALLELALESVELISQETDGFYGELGVDLAIDHEGYPWIIEINTKPSKNMDPKKNKPTIRPSTKAIVKYCTFLAYSEMTKGDKEC